MTSTSTFIELVSVLLFATPFLQSQGNPADFALPNSSELQSLYRQPLKLPNVTATDRCRTSSENRNAVPHVGYIFCADLCSWFGNGPVYLAFTHYDKQARNISLAGIPAEDSGYSIKTPFVSRPEYTGPILVRGRRFGTGDKVLFDGGGYRFDDLKLLAPRRAEATQW